MLWNLHSITPASVLNARVSALADTRFVLIISNSLSPTVFLFSFLSVLFSLSIWPEIMRIEEDMPSELVEVWGPWAVTEVRQVALEWPLRVDKYGRRTLQRMVGVLGDSERIHTGVGNRKRSAVQEHNRETGGGGETKMVKKPGKTMAVFSHAHPRCLSEDCVKLCLSLDISNGCC